MIILIMKRFYNPTPDLNITLVFETIFASHITISLEFGSASSLDSFLLCRGRNQHIRFLNGSF